MDRPCEQIHLLRTDHQIVDSIVRQPAEGQIAAKFHAGTAANNRKAGDIFWHRAQGDRPTPQGIPGNAENHIHLAGLCPRWRAGQRTRHRQIIDAITIEVTSGQSRPQEIPPLSRYGRDCQLRWRRCQIDHGRQITASPDDPHAPPIHGRLTAVSVLGSTDDQVPDAIVVEIAHGNVTRLFVFVTTQIVTFCRAVHRYIRLPALRRPLRRRSPKVDVDLAGPIAGVVGPIREIRAHCQVGDAVTVDVAGSQVRAQIILCLLAKEHHIDGARYAEVDEHRCQHSPDPRHQK